MTGIAIYSLSSSSKIQYRQGRMSPADLCDYTVCSSIEIVISSRHFRFSCSVEAARPDPSGPVQFRPCGLSIAHAWMFDAALVESCCFASVVVLMHGPLGVDVARTGEVRGIFESKRPITWSNVAPAPPPVDRKLGR
jgi:hypothetical protein